MSTSTIDFDRFRLRTFVEGLVGSPEIEVRDDPVELADVAQVFEDVPRALWLRQVGPERAEVVGNVVASRSWLARAFGTTSKGLLPEMARRLRGRPEVVEVGSAAAPVHQVVSTGADADLTRLPVHLQHEFDGAPYVSASMDFTVDPATGWTNVGFRRLMLRGPRETGVDLVAPSDLRAIYMARAEQGVPQPPRYESPRFPSVRAALEDGPKYFAALMAAVGSRDGRDVVRALDDLRRDGKLDRDDRGRYLLG